MRVFKYKEGDVYESITGNIYMFLKYKNGIYYFLQHEGKTPQSITQHQKSYTGLPENIIVFYSFPFSKSELIFRPKTYKNDPGIGDIINIHGNNYIFLGRRKTNGIFGWYYFPIHKEKIYCQSTIYDNIYLPKGVIGFSSNVAD